MRTEENQRKVQCTNVNQADMALNEGGTTNHQKQKRKSNYNEPLKRKKGPKTLKSGNDKVQVLSLCERKPYSPSPSATFVMLERMMSTKRSDSKGEMRRYHLMKGKTKTLIASTTTNKTSSNGAVTTSKQQNFSKDTSNLNVEAILEETGAQKTMSSHWQISKSFRKNVLGDCIRRAATTMKTNENPKSKHIDNSIFDNKANTEIKGGDLKQLISSKPKAPTLTSFSEIKKERGQAREKYKPCVIFNPRAFEDYEKCADEADFESEEKSSLQNDSQFFTTMKCEMKSMEDSPQDNQRAKVPKATKNVNENYVRLNLKNSSGSCKIARKKNFKQRLRNKGSIKSDKLLVKNFKQTIDQNQITSESSAHQPSKIEMVPNADTGIDPLDDFLDGRESNLTDSKAIIASPPTCLRHQRRAKMCRVKSNRSGNKNRFFYVCSLPRGEQCNFFQWVEDEHSSVQETIKKSSLYSDFVRRRVKAHADFYRKYTVPELRAEARKRGLNCSGVKSKRELLKSLLDWVHTEVLMGCRETSNGIEIIETEDYPKNEESTVLSQATGKAICNESSDVVATRYVHGVGHCSGRIQIDGILCNSYDSDSNDSKSLVSNGSDNDELEIIPLQNTNLKFDNEMQRTLYSLYGYKTFRSGQEWAINRCLDQRRSLLVAPTGSGKSLCYIIPAALLEGCTVVVSPLISLIQDQLRKLPPRIPAATLSGALSSSEIASITQDLRLNRLRLLFVSPERLTSSTFRRLLQHKYNTTTKRNERVFPPVSLLCVDEAHCVSQWGHNFRPSYLRIQSILAMLDPKSILALTATAGPKVIEDICSTLHISNVDEDKHSRSEWIKDESSDKMISNEINDNCIKVLDVCRENIDVLCYISNDDCRRRMLNRLLRTHMSNGSVIVYVGKRGEAEVLAEQLNVEKIPGGVVFYHAGMTMECRERAQVKFMLGKARVCVATVAFGLGIDKSDIRGIVHFGLPQSLEAYIQEIGRAGRDGMNATAISFLASSDFVAQMSLAHSDGLSKCQLKSLLLILRNQIDEALCDFRKTGFCNVPSLRVAFSIEKCAISIDCKTQIIETVLSKLESDALFGKSFLSFEGVLFDEAVITLKKRTISQLSSNEIVIAAISKCGIKLESKRCNKNIDIDDEEGYLVSEKENEYLGMTMQSGFYAYSFGTFKFSIMKCARYMGTDAEPRHVFAALRRLQTSGELELALHNSPNERCIQLSINNYGIQTFKSHTVCSRNHNIQSDDSQQPNVESIGFDHVVEVLSWNFTKLENLSARRAKEISAILYQIALLSPSIEGVEDLLKDGGSQLLPKGETKETPSELKIKRTAFFNKVLRCHFKDYPELDISQDITTQEISFKKFLAKIISDVSSEDSNSFNALINDVRFLLRNAFMTNFSESSPSHSFRMNFGSKQHTEYTARRIASILHSIDSPKTPSKLWYSHPLFGKWRHYSYRSVYDMVLKLLHDELAHK